MTHQVKYAPKKEDKVSRKKLHPAYKMYTITLATYVQYTNEKNYDSAEKVAPF